MEETPDGSVYLLKSYLVSVWPELRKTHTAKVAIVKGSCIVSVTSYSTYKEIAAGRAGYHVSDPQTYKTINKHPEFNHDREADMLESARQKAEEVFGMLDCGDSAPVQPATNVPANNSPDDVLIAENQTMIFLTKATFTRVGDPSKSQEVLNTDQFTIPAGSFDSLFKTPGAGEDVSGAIKLNSPYADLPEIDLNDILNNKPEFNIPSDRELEVTNMGVLTLIRRKGEILVLDERNNQWMPLNEFKKVIKDVTGESLEFNTYPGAAAEFEVFQRSISILGNTSVKFIDGNNLNLSSGSVSIERIPPTAALGAAETAIPRITVQ